jgi:hypothetical protein
MPVVADYIRVKIIRLQSYEITLNSKHYRVTVGSSQSVVRN